ncbi:hypothetical protein TeGR_g7204 [Tetraparma gracilis]|uniref:Uncharacterized protein n=1 Tax=Tetraparma gracilis TaxID=2962635 RepID=A0ABQ6N2V4_9STRA|nr:hypothetical protein TeGR_g7204 [Tetraparma gracilis]
MPPGFDKAEALEKDAATSTTRRTVKRAPRLLDSASYSVSSDGRHVTVCSSATVRATPEAVAASSLSLYESSAFKIESAAAKKKKEVNKTLERGIRHRVIYRRAFVPTPFQDREWVQYGLAKRISSTEFYLAAVDCNHPEAPAKNDSVRASLLRATRLTLVAPGLTRIAVTSQVDLRGSIPLRINNTMLIPRVIGTPINILRPFAQRKEENEFDAGGEDAKVLGRLLACDVGAKMRTKGVLCKSDMGTGLEDRLTLFMDRTSVLRGARVRYPWFQALLFETLRNRVRPPSAARKALEDFGEEHARKAGRGLALALIANVSAEAAVDEWVMTYPALRELEQQCTWMRPMMNAAAAEMLARTSWGVQFRAYFGAAVSFFDVVTDSYMIHTYFTTGRAGTANALLGMLLGNLGFQAVVVYIQAQGLKKDKVRTLLFELLTVVSFVKPGVDAFRVASGAEQLAGAALSPLTEMSWTKVGEMVFEGIPGLVVQLIAMLVAGEAITKGAVVSVAISVASTALTATTLFWDADTDPGMRKRNPDWVGIIPDLGRTPAFIIIFAICAFQTLGKTAATALLAVTNSSWLLYYVLGDHALYILYTFSRRDFHVYTPVPRALSVVTSIMFRTMSKIVSDFTGSPSTRLPNVLGGSYWFCNLLASQASVFVAVHLYNEYATGDDKIEARALWYGAGAVVAAWALAFAVFTTRIAVPKYRRTLWSSTTGRQWVQDCFLKRETDEGKFGIFASNLLLWESNIGEEVKAWAAENWERWREEKPAWFKPELVPDQFIPAAELEQLGYNRKRRGSASGSARESFRE